MSSAPFQPPERNVRNSMRTSAIPAWSMRVIACAVIGAVLWLGKPAFAPILFSVLLTLLLSPLVDALERNRVPRFISSVGIVCMLVVLIGVVIDVAWGPAQRWVDDAPKVLQSIEHKVRPARLVIARIESITTRATTIATGPVTPPAEKAIKLPEIDPLRLGRAILVDVATISILTLFLLIGGNRTLLAAERASQNENGRSYKCMRIIRSVRSELSRYYLTLTGINICLGFAVGCAMALWNLPSPWLWGIMVGVLNFIPYVGPAISLAVLTVVSLVTFEGYGIPAGVAATFLCLTTLEGQLVQPLLIGFRLNLNPIILSVSIWLAGWFWGVAGVFLVTPTLVMLKEIAMQQDDNSLLKALLVGHSP